MKKVRVIPRIDIKGPNLVKGIHLEGLRVLGSPGDFAKYYYENGADELLFMDVVASLYERNSLDDIISKTAKEIFIPITVGGGLRSLDDIERILHAGADKVSINTAAVNNPEFISQASKKFGSSTIVVAIEAIKQPDGSYLIYTDNGREHTGVEALSWAKKVEELGAGELIITSVDKEGTGEGYDLELIEMISKEVSIPVIVHGGPGSKEHVLKAAEISGVDAVSLATILHYGFIKDHASLNSVSNESEGNTEFLKQARGYKNLDLATIQEIKAFLLENNIDCRP